MLIFYLLCFGVVLKKVPYYAQYYAHNYRKYTIVLILFYNLITRLEYVKQANARVVWRHAPGKILKNTFSAYSPCHNGVRSFIANYGDVYDSLFH